jgi:hypothetical protein
LPSPLLFYSVDFDPEDGRDTFPPKRQFAHGSISLKMATFICQHFPQRVPCRPVLTILGCEVMRWRVGSYARAMLNVRPVCLCSPPSARVRTTCPVLLRATLSPAPPPPVGLIKRYAVKTFGGRGLRVWLQGFLTALDGVIGGPPPSVSRLSRKCRSGDVWTSTADWVARKKHVDGPGHLPECPEWGRLAYRARI